MKTSIVLFTLCSSLLVSQAAVVNFSLSPPGTDTAIGLSPANESPAVTNSTGSGNVISAGISLDSTPTNATLTFAIGYGSAPGFSDLTGPATVVGIHGPAPTNEIGPLLFDLVPYTYLAGDPAKGGVMFGSIPLTVEQASNVVAGLTYINISTAGNTNGEIRGQIVNGAPQLVCPQDATIECTGQPTTLTAHVTDAEGDALQVTWSLNGVAVQTNLVAQGSGTNGADVALNITLEPGTNVVEVAVSDGAGHQTTCTSTVIVYDTTPPTIARATVSPRTLWPPNHKLVPVEVRVQAHDTCCTPAWKIISVSSNEPVGRGHGSGNTEPDWVISGDHGLSLRAERSGQGNGRVYVITVQAEDCAGNLSAPKTVTVKVDHDMGRR